MLDYARLYTGLSSTVYRTMQDHSLKHWRLAGEKDLTRCGPMTTHVAAVDLVHTLYTLCAKHSS